MTYMRITPGGRWLYAIFSLLLALLLYSAVGAQTDGTMLSPAPPDASVSAATNLAVFDDAWQTVREHFYDPRLQGLDWQAMREQYRPLAAAAASVEERSAVINRLLAELGVSHTRHYTPAEPAYYELLDIFAGALRRELPRLFPDGQVAYVGIGVLTRQIGSKTFVSGVLEGLPAAKAGLRVGDQLIAAAGAPYHPLTPFAARVGEQVTLQVRRSPDGPVQDIVVIPERIRPHEAFLNAMEESARIIDTEQARIGYIHIWSYAGTAYQRLLERELSSGRLKDAEALILDLRDGWGGAQPHYLDLFNLRAPTMVTVERNGSRSVVNFKWRKPVTLLVNNGTRSGKEILTHGFKTYNLGEIVGTRTAGAVLAARAFLLRDNSLLVLAVEDVFVDGTRLEGIGVTPTIDVPFPLEYAQGKDPQLERAVALLAYAIRG
jgi:carboxyl-terminal processing protease